jgi:hypothetical protein
MCIGRPHFWPLKDRLCRNSGAQVDCGARFTLVFAPLAGLQQTRRQRIRICDFAASGADRMRVGEYAMTWLPKGRTCFWRRVPYARPRSFSHSLPEAGIRSTRSKWSLHPAVRIRVFATSCLCSMFPATIAIRSPGAAGLPAHAEKHV